MKRIHTVIAFATSVALATAGSAAGANQKKHEAKYCAALSSLDKDLLTLDELGPDASVREMRAALKRVENDARTIEKQAAGIKTESARQFVRSSRQLQAETSNIPDNMTVGQVRTRIHDDLRNVKRNAQTLANESGCPDAMRGMREQGDIPQSREQMPQGTRTPGY